MIVIPALDCQNAVKLMEQGSYEKAVLAFSSLGDYRDSAAQIQACNYAIAESLLVEGDKAQAAIAFSKAGDYQDARQRCMELWSTITQRETISAGSSLTVGLKADGTVVAVGDDEDGQCNVSGWRNIKVPAKP